MEHLPEPLLNWLLQYGSFALFGLLALGIIAFPVPEETLMVVSGILMSEGKLHVPSTIIAAYAGAMCGITISYALGSIFGFYLLDKYGGGLGFTDDKKQYVQSWFERYGKWTLFFGYFVPGIRHFTGFTAGASRLKYREFALFAYCGAIVWASLFLSIGYFFEEYWLSLFRYFEEYLDQILTISLLVLLVYLVYLFFRKK
jgi:membrane protein DedA with SNARE-associated domain